MNAMEQWTSEHFNDVVGHNQAGIPCTVGSHDEQAFTGVNTQRVMVLNTGIENVTHLRGVQKNTVCNRCKQVIGVHMSFEKV